MTANITKTGKARIAFSRLGAPFDRLLKLSQHTNDEDYVFVDNETGNQIGKDVYYRQWNKMRNSINLDKKFTYYCLRHTYATYALMKKVNIHDLSKVMGCSVKFIEDHYGHVDLEKIRDEFTQDLRNTESGKVLFD